MTTQSDWRAFLPPAKQDAVARALESCFATIATQEVTTLTGGGSDSILLKITVADRPYVLRVIQQIHMLNEPARQFRCLRIMSDAGISPHVHYADAEDAVTITEFIPTVPFASYRGSALRGIVETVRAIHATPLFPAFTPYMDLIDNFIAMVRSAGMLPTRTVGEYLAHYAEIQAAYPRHDPDLVSSHNDLNPRNILFDGAKFWVIDWDTAFPNDRYADLATVGNFFIQNDSAGTEEELLGAYFGDTLDDYKRARFFLMRQINHMYYAMLLFLSASGARPADGKWDDTMATPSLREFHGGLAGESGGTILTTAEGRYLYGKVRMNEALRLMRTPRFAPSLRLMR